LGQIEQKGMSEFSGSITPPLPIVASAPAAAPAAVVEEPLRMWTLLHQLDNALQTMQGDELRGALMVLGPLCAYLNRIYFEEKRDFNRKSLVKTIEEAYEIAMQAYIQESSSDGEDSE
jgi:hypothetical protein